eukprot:Selendium_serpulae@DN5986_c1_g2_i4.p1
MCHHHALITSQPKPKPQKEQLPLSHNLDVAKERPQFEKYEDIPDDDIQVGQGCVMSDGFLDGKRRSVLIGINYTGMNGELRGCVNDVHRMRNFIEKNGFPEGHEQWVLTDEDSAEFTDDANVKHTLPTKENILLAIGWLMHGVAKGDSLYFHYSGHGVRVPDTSNDEDDGMDEAIVPLDYQKHGVIVDDLLHHLLIDGIPKGARLTAVMDCCHSGSGLDLPLIYTADSAKSIEEVKQAKENFQKNQALQKKLGAAVKGKEQSNTRKGMRRDMLKKAMREQHQRKRLWKKDDDLLEDAEDDEEREMIRRVLGMHGHGHEERKKSDLGDEITSGCAVLFSGCQDVQTSGDVSSTKMFDLPETTGPEGAGGACTAALIKTVSENPSLTFIEVLDGMRKDLNQKGFKQVPQISSTVAFDLNNQFDLER